MPIALLDAVGHPDKADTWAEKFLLSKDYSKGDSFSEVQEIAESFKKRGKWEFFEKLIRHQLPEEFWRELENRIKRRY